ncbi:hypothetical protein GCM10010417_30290 [Streptomyces carpaticus]
MTVEALAEPLRRRAERDAERARGEADSDPDDWHPELHTANEAGNTVLSQAVRLPRTSRARRLARPAAGADGAGAAGPAVGPGQGPPGTRRRCAGRAEPGAAGRQRAGGGRGAADPLSDG